MSVSAPAADDPVLSGLRSAPPFVGVRMSALRRLARLALPTVREAGTTLLREGEVGDAAYVVVHGRLRVVRDGPSGRHVLADVGPGGMVGELGMLAGLPRAATVEVVRDSLLLALPGPALLALTDQEPQLLRALSRQAASQAAIRAPAAPSARLVAVIPLGHADVGRARSVARGLVRALRRAGRCRMVEAGALPTAGSSTTRPAGDDEQGAGPLAACDLGWLDALARDHDVVVHLADAASTAWTRRCLREADDVLVVVDAAAPLAGRSAEGAVAALLRASGRTAELVLVHPATRRLPASTGALSSAPWATHVHHVQDRDRDGTARLARTILGTSVTIALGGGGPRGFAHLGVLRALEELGVPVDGVVGTSIGAIMGASKAMGWAHEERVERSLDGFVRTRNLVGATLPLVAVSSSRKLTGLLRSEAYFGEADIEDLWLPFACISTDLSTASAAVHERGPVWRALRASLSLPGVFPPVTIDGHLHVDGAILANLPVDAARRRSRGPVLAVDLEPSSGPGPSAEFAPTVSGWKVLGQRIRPRSGGGTRVPSALEVLRRCKEVSVHGGATAAPDVLLRPPVDGVGGLDFKAGPPLIEAAYRATLEDLVGSPALERLLPRSLSRS